MRKLKISKISLAAFALIALVAGCGREQTPVLVPAVIAAVPANGADRRTRLAGHHRDFQSADERRDYNYNDIYYNRARRCLGELGAVTYSGTTATFTPTAIARPEHRIYRHDYNGREKCCRDRSRYQFLLGLSRPERFP